MVRVGIERSAWSVWNARFIQQFYGRNDVWSRWKGRGSFRIPRNTSNRPRNTHSDARRFQRTFSWPKREVREPSAISSRRFSWASNDSNFPRTSFWFAPQLMFPQPRDSLVQIISQSLKVQNHEDPNHRGWRVTSWPRNQTIRDVLSTKSWCYPLSEPCQPFQATLSLQKPPSSSCNRGSSEKKLLG